MSEKITLLDKALAMSEAELGYLTDGEVEKAESAAMERGELIRRILSMEDDTAADELMDKLTQLKNMQVRLTGEAKRLHEQLKQDLGRTKQEGRRMSGYSKGASSGPVMQSKFLSKRG